MPCEWLQRFQATTAPRLAECSPLQLLTLFVSLMRLGAAPAAAAAAATSGTSPAALTLTPASAWQAAWWQASSGQLRRLRYSLNELLLTCGWLAALGVQPPGDWLAACAEATAAYQPALTPGEQQKLAAALTLLLAARRPGAKPAASEQPHAGALDGAPGTRTGLDDLLQLQSLA